MLSSHLYLLCVPKMMSLLNVNPSILSRSRLWYICTSSLLLFIFFILWSLVPAAVQRTPFRPPPPFLFKENSTTDSIKTISNYFQAYPLSETKFGELGNRLQILRAWISLADEQSPGSAEVEVISHEVEKYALSQFPFLRNPSQSPDGQTPLNALRKSYVPGSKGIVIPAGKSNFRYCCHLIRCIRSVHGSQLPIQVAYAGDTDLPTNYRSYIESMGKDIETLNVLDVFDDATLDLAHGGWAIKPFALLASKFEETILADADAVFVQSPNVIFDTHTQYQRAGTLLFHDRLLWQGAFRERHEWWEREMEHHTPSETLSKSKVYMEGYAEEGDSGLVVMDKSRLAAFIGLLHVCWQNTKIVRDQVTYVMGYGDKESWWFGLELSGAPYAFEDHYGAVLGTEQVVDGTFKVCGFTIAHVGEHQRLLWYNGSLLKNKATNKTEYSIPSHWMIDGVWEKGHAKADFSCMKEAEVRGIQKHEMTILTASVEAAKALDMTFGNLVEIKDES